MALSSSAFGSGLVRLFHGRDPLPRWRESRYTLAGPPHHLPGKASCISAEDSGRSLRRLGGLRQAVRHAFAGVATGQAKALPKANLDLGVGHFFQAMVAADSRTDWRP